MSEDSPNPSQILAEYDARLGLYDSFRRACEALLNRLLEVEGYRVHSITSRIKRREMLEGKLTAPDKRYETLSEITDIAGLRVITYFEDDVDSIGNLIEREFDIDSDRSVDKRKAMDPDRFGYLSLHYICGLAPDRVKLVEHRQYEGLVCEIQIRSILQHAWAEIEHDLGYKAGAVIPAPIRRRFSRLAGLLELADSEFARLRDELASYASRIGGDIAKNPSAVGVDDVSLSAFIQTDSVVGETDKVMAESVGAQLHEMLDVQPLVNELHYVGLKNLGDVRNSLQMNKDLIVRQWLKRAAPREFAELASGISLFHLFQVLIAKKGDAGEFRMALEKLGIGLPSKRDKLAAEIVGLVRESSGP